MCIKNTGVTWLKSSLHRVCYFILFGNSCYHRQFSTHTKIFLDSLMNAPCDAAIAVSLVHTVRHIPLPLHGFCSCVSQLKLLHHPCLFWALSTWTTLILMSLQQHLWLVSFAYDVYELLNRLISTMDSLNVPAWICLRLPALLQFSIHSKFLWSCY